MSTLLIILSMFVMAIIVFEMNEVIARIILVLANAFDYIKKLSQGIK
ncbi:hypothetical protein [Desertivirga brevis]|nr:hypothetical protein [Pedobacter sp. SYSU D00873]